MCVSFRMKCVLCNYQNNHVNELKEHYFKDHNVDKNNVFFKKLIEKKKILFTIESAITVMSLFF